MSFRPAVFSFVAALAVSLALGTPVLAAEAKVVAFTSDDGVALSGLWYGAGEDVVILSHQYDLDQSAWADVANSLADQGYGVLTYNFRGYKPSEGNQDIGAIGHDLDAAIAFARAGGARNLVLVGASMGGIVTVPAAVKAEPLGYITLSAPLGFAGLAADDASLIGSKAAKLFINTENDSYIADTKHMFAVASEPKTLEIYPGGEHAMSMFPAAHGAEAKARIVSFIKDVMPL
ncbi:MAG TPA: alpha/beta fold hydrolase [Devosia sp.]|nr:alpha/beta fold hydrolase [Devosia sp.]